MSVREIGWQVSWKSIVQYYYKLSHLDMSSFSRQVSLFKQPIKQPICSSVVWSARLVQHHLTDILQVFDRYSLFIQHICSSVWTVHLQQCLNRVRSSRVSTSCVSCVRCSASDIRSSDQVVWFSIIRHVLDRFSTDIRQIFDRYSTDIRQMFARYSTY